MTIGDAINASKIDEGYENFTSTANSETKQVSWNNPTTMDEHLFLAMVYAQDAVIDPNTFDGIIGGHSDSFIQIGRAHV